MRKIKKIIILSFIPLIFTGCQISKNKISQADIDYVNSLELEKQKELSKKTDNNKIDAKEIPYISCLDGKCLIPKASGLPMDDRIVCLWNYTAGNGSIPYMDETKGCLPSIIVPDVYWDLTVLCRDQNGIVYFGKKKNLP